MGADGARGADVTTRTATSLGPGFRCPSCRLFYAASIRPADDKCVCGAQVEATVPGGAHKRVDPVRVARVDDELVECSDGRGDETPRERAESQRAMRHDGSMRSPERKLPDFVPALPDVVCEHCARRFTDAEFNARPLISAVDERVADVIVHRVTRRCVCNDERGLYRVTERFAGRHVFVK